MAELLEADGIPMVLLKGWALVPLVYHDLALRPLSDVDILVPKEHVEAVVRALESMGYVRPRCACCPDGNSERHGTKPSLVSAEGVAIDVHSERWCDWDMDGLWARTRLVAIGGREYLVPSPEDLLVHVAVHFYGDRRRGSAHALGQVCDVAHLVAESRPSVDWAWLEAELGLREPGMAVPLALAAAERLLQAPVPEGVVHRLCPPHLTVRVVERYVEQRVLRDRPSMSPARLNPRRVAWRLLVPNRRYLEQRYGRSLTRAAASRIYARRIVAGSRLATRTLMGAPPTWPSTAPSATVVIRSDHAGHGDDDRLPPPGRSPLGSVR